MNRRSSTEDEPTQSSIIVQEVSQEDLLAYIKSQRNEINICTFRCLLNRNIRKRKKM